MNTLQAQQLPTPSQTYSTLVTSGPQTNMQPARGIKMFNQVTIPGSGTITPVIYWTDQWGTDYPALSGTPISTATKSTITIYPGLTTVPGSTLNDALPKNFHVDVIISSGPVSFTSSYSLLA